MKSTFQLILAGIIGGAIAFGAFKMFDKDTIIYEQNPSQSNITHQVSNSKAIDVTTNFVKAAEVANPAVVHISAENNEYAEYKQGKRRNYDPFEQFWGYRRQQGERPQAGTGSGVIIDEQGTIVTNNHVVGFADILSVTLHDGRVYAAEKIGTDPSTDLAVIRLKEARSIDHLPSLTFADSDQLKVGEWVVAVGNPFNLTSTVTAGIVSAIGRDLDIIGEQKAIEEFIQTDAVVNPGNSGGALVNTKGELVGINTAISSPTGVYAGYSFAIPGNLVKRVVNEIIEVGGDVQRAMLGITIADINEELIDQAKAQGIKIKTNNGVLVTGFDQRRYSSAKYSGMELGDVITGVEGHTVSNSDELREAIKWVKVGDTVSVDVNRDGKKKTIPVKLRNGI